MKKKNLPPAVVFDIGNTYSKVGFFDFSGKFIFQERIKLPTLITAQKNQEMSFEVKQKLIQLLAKYGDKFPAIFILGGVSQTNLNIIKDQLVRLSKEVKYADCFYKIQSFSDGKKGNPVMIELDINSPWGLEFEITTMSTLGLDRIANLVAAAHEWPQSTLLVADAGTAVTIDLLTQGKVFAGGTISPGLKMITQALAEHTDNLPLVNPRDYQEIQIGRSTASAVGSGLLHGFAGMVERLSERMLELCKTRPKGIATGGDGDLLIKHTEFYTIYRPNLTLTGYYLTGIKVFRQI